MHISNSLFVFEFWRLLFPKFPIWSTKALKNDFERRTESEEGGWVRFCGDLRKFAVMLVTLVFFCIFITVYRIFEMSLPSRHKIISPLSLLTDHSVFIHYASAPLPQISLRQGSPSRPRSNSLPWIPLSLRLLQGFA